MSANRRNSIHSWLWIVMAGWLAAACGPVQKQAETREKKQEEKKIALPAFNADSAYQYIQEQVGFGPRVPGSEAHSRCASYLAGVLERFADTVVEQAFKARSFDNTILSGTNIIAEFNREAKARIALASHWDSRPFADHDPDPAKRSQPISGANDGASGVGILLEVARLLHQTRPDIGIDIILFDLEDYGPPEDDQKEPKNENWGLGSQYWSKNPHVINYRPRFVILLDMVGASDATFLQEGFSMYFAPDKVEKVWDIAHSLGYDQYFIKKQGGYINDDHYFINELLKVPAIDIIHLDDKSSNGSFFEYWHTTGDTIDKIDKSTLQVVGNVVMKVIFTER